MQNRWKSLGAIAMAGFAAGLAWTAEPPSQPPEKPAVAAIPAETLPKPHPAPPLDRKALEQAIERGKAFLLRRQNANGSWGSPHSWGGDIYDPVPGSHHAFRAGVTALCLSALIEIDSRDPAVDKAIGRGQQWLLENISKLRRATPDTLYNNWGHAYSIQALAKLHRRHQGNAAAQDRIRRELEGQWGLLTRYECVDGGWCYYDFEARTQKPSGSTLSFMTATVLIALDEAKPLLKPEPRLVQRATASIRRQRNPDFAYNYGEYLNYRPRHPVNRPAGSLGRSQVCNLAMRLWGDKEVTDEILVTWLDRLFARNLWLDMGRKRPIPHESWFSVAGYFFYYGHYYAARVIEELPRDRRDPYRDLMAAVLIPLQEPDGSWWDFPMFDYHKQYGTAFALMSLVRCRKPQ